MTGRFNLHLVDDGSTDDSAGVIAELAKLSNDIVPMLGAENAGAGIARNRGWEAVTGRYTLFFDADDHLMTDVIPPAIARLDAEPDVDTAVFAYRYERDDTSSFTDMSYTDKAIMTQLLKGQSQQIGRLEEFARLLGFTNYPWNKLLRTERFRKTGMKFGSTKVNNDILGHWYALLFARQILVSEEVLCHHIVHPTGANLTNQFNSNRLQVITALSELYDLLEKHPAMRRRYSHHFWGFARNLIAWARPRLSPELQLELDELYSRLLSRIDLEDYVRMRVQRSPDLANHISQRSCCDGADHAQNLHHRHRL